MSFGLPVITTPYCGSVIENNKEGFIVPIRNSETLAYKIKEIVENRTLRMKMSNASFNKAKKYTWANYKKNLLKVLND